MSTGIVSARHPLHAAILVRPRPKRLGVWLVAGTPTSQPYPCRCRARGECTELCPCHGRQDVVYYRCCARRVPRE